MNLDLNNGLVSAENVKFLIDAKDAAESIKEIIPTNELEYAELCDITKDMRKLKNEVDEERLAATKPYRDKQKIVNDIFNKVIDIIQATYRKCNSGCSDWERKKAEIARKQQEELNRKAEEERQRKLREAQELAEKGKKEEAARASQEANLTVAPIIAPVTKTKGRTVKETWTGEVMNKDKFIKWCIKNNKLEFLMADEKAWNAHAKVIRRPFTLLGVCRIFKKEVRY